MAHARGAYAGARLAGHTCPCLQAGWLIPGYGAMAQSLAFRNKPPGTQRELKRCASCGIGHTLPYPMPYHAAYHTLLCTHAAHRRVRAPTWTATNSDDSSGPSSTAATRPPVTSAGMRAHSHARSRASAAAAAAASGRSRRAPSRSAARAQPRTGRSARAACCHARCGAAWRGAPGRRARGAGLGGWSAVACRSAAAGQRGVAWGSGQAVPARGTQRGCHLSLTARIAARGGGASVCECIPAADKRCALSAAQHQALPEVLGPGRARCADAGMQGESAPVCAYAPWLSWMPARLPAC